MKHLRKFNESKSSVMDGIVPFIMDYAPYIKSLSAFSHLFKFTDSVTWKFDKAYDIRNFCSYEVIQHQIFYHLDGEKLQGIFNDNIGNLLSDEKVSRHFEYVCSLEKECYKEEVDTEIGALNLLRNVLEEKISTEFIILIRMYLILKWTIWNDVKLIEDSLIEYDDEKITYDLSLAGDIYPEWNINVNISSSIFDLNRL